MHNNGFINACIDRGRTVVLLLIMILVMGVWAFNNIAKEKEPDVQIPFIYVSMTHTGISPEDAERMLVRPMEAELKSIEGVKEMTAYASEGRASVTLEFNPGFDSDKALNDVRERVDIAKSELPDETNEPKVNEVNLSLFPVLNVILTGDLPERSLISVAKNLRDRLEKLPNVLEVDIGGDREEAVEIIIEPKFIESYGLTLETLSNIANGFNRLVAAGALDAKNGRFSIKVPGLLENLNDILSLPLKVNGDAVITVRDVATIKKTYKDRTGYARSNGKRAIVLEVSKRTGTNLIETIEQVKQVINAEKEFLPSKLNIEYSQDQSENIIDMLNDLKNNIILAVLLVMLVILIFVGLRSAALITVAIPGAFLIGILILFFLQLTINIVVLFSLILSIGMLVDSAIVVCEMADKKIAQGIKPRRAYMQAAEYVKWPLIASTATTLVVFMPLLFWPGIVGQFMKYMPITLIATLSGSLLMALVFLPTLGSLFGTPKKLNQNKQTQEQNAQTGDISQVKGFTGSYYKVLKKILSFGGLFTATIFILLIVVYSYYAKFGTGVEFFPDIEPENSQVQIQARGNLSIDEKDAIVKQVEERIFKLKDEVRVFYSRTGTMGEGGQQSLTPDTIGVIQMEYADWQKRRKSKQINQEIRELTSDIGGIIVKTQNEQAGPGSAKPIEIDIGSRNPKLLDKALKQLKEVLSSTKGIIDIEDNSPVPEIEWEMQLDRQMAAKFGNNVSTIGSFIRFITNGLVATTYRPDDSDDEVDILIRFPKEDRNLATLNALKIVTAQGAVPASNFVTRIAKPKVGTINRTEGLRTFTITANVEDGVLADSALNQIKETLRKAGIDKRILISFKGDDEEQKEAGAFLSGAFVLALFCMALILVTQFNSLYYMFIILSAVLLSTVGVLLGLIITNQPFGIVMCGVGIISVAGIVVNNNIIFIDTFKKLKEDNMDITEALLRTGVQRLRPILLTAGTTVLGLVPMVLGMNIDFFALDITFGAPSGQWWKQLATAIAGGLSFATVLTLFLTPCLLLIGEKFSRH